MNETRRRWLQGALALAAGLTPQLRGAPVSRRSNAAFAARDLDAALRELFGVARSELVPNDKIRLNVPAVAENGAIVPLTVTADLDRVEQIAILAADNPNPLTSIYAISIGTLPYVSTRIKMRATAEVLAVAKSGSRVYYTARRVKVSVGGCS
ncbi:MAG: thiosulfate oxidation carrier protein SoxY [Gammaproteobacteria bacterium]|nr:thiosulfate oxidation carrier protein SoxY [Gammaproteobacteria bacterium]